MIQQGFERAKSTKREKLLIPKKRVSSDSKVRFISSYNSRWGEMREILQRHWPVLMLDSTIKQHVFTIPQMTYKRSKNLRDLLVHSHYPG